MSCPIESIRRYAAGDELNPAEYSLIQAHIRECRPCQEYYYAEGALTEGIRDVPRISVPADFSIRVLSRLRVSAPGLLVPGWNWQKTALVLAMVMLLSGFTILIEAGLQSEESGGFLDSLIIRSFNLLVDVLTLGLRSALSLADILIAVVQAAWWILKSCSRGLISMPPVWLFLLFSLFTLSHGVLYWMLRRQSGARKTRQ
jgi:hypothetical protein